MKRSFALFLILVLLLCGCTDAEFYDGPSSAASIESSGENVGLTGSNALYEILYMFSDSGYVSGAMRTVCKIDLETGLASPLCYDPACLHDMFCPATGAVCMDATDDGRYVYFRSSVGHIENEHILYVYSTETGELKELDRSDPQNGHMVLAFDDGAVFNKVESERNELGEEISFTNTLYKVTPGGKITLLREEALLQFKRYGQMACSGEKIYDSNMELITTVEDHDSSNYEQWLSVLQRPFAPLIDTSNPEQMTAQRFYRKEDGTYGKAPVSERVRFAAPLESVLLLTETPEAGEQPVIIGSSALYRSLYTIQCIDPYTGQVLRRIDLTERFEEWGITDIQNLFMPTRKGVQGIRGNYQILEIRGTDTLCYLPQVSFLFNANTGEVLRIHFGNEEE